MLLVGLSGPSIGAILIGLVLVALAAFLWMKAKPRYHLMFGTAGADQQALTSEDSHYVNRVANAINDAIVARG